MYTSSPLQTAAASAQQRPPQPASNSPFSANQLPPDLNAWKIDQVIGHLSLVDPSLAPHVAMFRTHEIDGKALLLLDWKMMRDYMEMKLGPALKVCHIVKKIQERNK